MNEEKFKIGLLGAGGNLKIQDEFLKYSSPYGKTFRVKISDIETITIDSVGMGKSKLKLIGHGSELAQVEMPTNWAEKCQNWIMTKIK